MVQVPFYQDRIKEVEIPVNTYITQPEIVEKVVEKVVEVEKVIETVNVVKEENERIVEQRI